MRSFDPADETKARRSRLRLESLQPSRLAAVAGGSGAILAGGAAVAAIVALALFLGLG